MTLLSSCVYFFIVSADLFRKMEFLKSIVNFFLGTSNSQRSSSNPTQLPQPKRVLFPRENVQLGWHRGAVKKWHTGVGMMNAGNTCYLNSTLQALFHVPAIANWLSSDGDHRDRCEQNGEWILLDLVFICGTF